MLAHGLEKDRPVSPFVESRRQSGQAFYNLFDIERRCLFLSGPPPNAAAEGAHVDDGVIIGVE